MQSGRGCHNPGSLSQESNGRLGIHLSLLGQHGLLYRKHKAVSPYCRHLIKVKTIYYMPFYFQAALNDSPLRSGINYMSLAIPQMIGLLAGGGIVTKWGHYVRVRPLCAAEIVDNGPPRCQ